MILFSLTFYSYESMGVSTLPNLLFYLLDSFVNSFLEKIVRAYRNLRTFSREDLLLELRVV